MENNTEQAKQGAKSTPPDMMTNKIVWIVGAVVLLLVGWFGLKPIIAPAVDYKVTLIDAPKEVNAGGIATFTWRADGPATTIHHTSVHLGTVSNPGDLGKEVQPSDTKYTDFVKDFANGDYNVPLQFIGNQKLDQEGTYYFRVHALINDKNYWSDEYTLDVKRSEPKVTILDIPKTTSAHKTTAFTWRVDGSPTSINHTSIHFGNVSEPGQLGTDIAPSDTKYTDLVKEFASGNFDIPLQFVGNAQIAKTGTYYLRGHAVIDGKNYWTDEYTLEVLPAITTGPTEVQQPQ